MPNNTNLEQNNTYTDNDNKYTIKHKTEIFKDLEIAFVNYDIFDKSYPIDTIIREIVKEIKTVGINGICNLYCGHQDDNKIFSILGDARSVNISQYFNTILQQQYQIIDNKINQIDITKKDLNITLKGIGRTPFAKNQTDILYSDGYMTSDSAILSYINSETLHKYNIDTERILAILKTNQKIKRYNKDKKIEQLHDGAIIIRISKPLIRIGTLEYLIHTNQIKEIQNIFDQYFLNYNLDQIFDIIKDNILQNFKKYHQKGFKHNMLNTDNITIWGQIIDTETQTHDRDLNQNVNNKDKDIQDLNFAFQCLDSIYNTIKRLK